MRWTLLALSTAIAATVWLPAEAAQPAAPAAASGDPITFEQYRDWRLAFIERRQSDLARQLAASDLPAQRKTRLEQVKAGIMELTTQTGDDSMPIKEIGHARATDRTVAPLLPR